MYAGLRIAPLNRQLTNTEIKQQCETLGASCLLFDSEFALQAASLTMQSLRLPESLGDKVVGAAQVSGTSSPKRPVKAGELCFFTSATTGKAKVVIRQQKDMSFADLMKAWRNKGEAFGLDGSGPHLLVGPTYHAAPLLYAIFDMLNGAPLYIMKRWSLPDVLQQIEEHDIAHTHFVPTYFKRCMDLSVEQRSQYQLGSLKKIFHGAAPISRELKQQCIEWLGPVLIEYWGASESGTCCLVDSQQWLQKPGTVGKAVKGMQLQVRDARGQVLPPGETGTIFAKFQHNRSPFYYLNDEEKTRQAIDPEGWFQLGDLGYIDEQGFLYLSGRESHTIISGGVNIYPAEIEAALLQHPQVQDALVFARPDDDKGEKVAALLQCDEDINPQSLELFLKDILAHYKWPRFWYFCRQMPVNEAGKVTRSILQQKGFLS